MADRGFEDSIKQGQNETCKVDTFTIEGPDVDMAMTCAEGGGTMTVAMKGTVTSTSSQLTMTMDGSVPELGSVLMQMDVQQERIGACE